MKSEYGGERLRPDSGEAGRMSRMPVGLANHPAINLKRQLSVANGCLISGPSCQILSVGLARASVSRLAVSVVRADFGEIFPEIAEPRACRLALSEAKKQ